MRGVTLVKPTVDLKDSFLEGLAEFQQEGLPWFMEMNPEELQQNFAAFVQSFNKKRTLWTQDEPVDESSFWAVRDGVYLGGISIRHRLNADLKMMGGHIGYDTRPSFRRQGVASEMLSLALPLARQIGIKQALLTCNDGNMASIKVIEKNGGVLKETKPQFEGGPLKRYYWIQL